MKFKQDTQDDDPYRDLTRRAIDESPGGYRSVAKEAGVGKNPDSGRVILHTWANGKKDRQSRWYKPALSAKDRKNLLAYLERAFPAECERIRQDALQANLEALAKILPRRPLQSPRQVFAKILAEKGVTEINSSEIRAGWDIQQLYAPDGGLTGEDLEVFGPLLSDIDREALAEAVESNRRAVEGFRSHQSRRNSSR